jgi:hypothetical protein
LLDVTPPPSPEPLANYYELGSSGTFSWVPNGGPDDSIASWQVELFENGILISTVSLPAAQTSYAFSGTPGAVYRARITAVSSAGISSLAPGQSDAGAPNPASPTTSVILLAAGSDSDGDGQTNADEQAAGTNPLDAGSVFRVGGLVRSGGTVQVTFSSVPGYSYRLETSITLDGAWSDVGPVMDANAAVSLLEAPVDGPRRFFRVRVVGGPAE